MKKGETLIVMLITFFLGHMILNLYWYNREKSFKSWK